MNSFLYLVSFSQKWFCEFLEKWKVCEGVELDEFWMWGRFFVLIWMKL